MPGVRRLGPLLEQARNLHHGARPELKLIVNTFHKGRGGGTEKAMSTCKDKEHTDGPRPRTLRHKRLFENSYVCLYSYGEGPATRGGRAEASDRSAE